MTVEVVREPMLPSDDRPPVYYDETTGRYVYRMSSIGLCRRALALLRMGYDRVDPHDFVAMAAEDGRQREPIIIERLKEMGWKVESRQLEIEIRLPMWIIRGHLDGIIVPGQEQERVTDSLGNPVRATEHILEIKTMSAARFDKLRKCGFQDPSFRTYAFQISAAMHRLGLPVLYVIEERETRELFLWLIEEPPYPLHVIYQHIMAAEKAAQTGEAPRCDEAASPYFCPVSYLCDDGSEVTGDKADVLNGLILSYQEARAIGEAAMARANEIKSAIIDMVVEGKPERKGKVSTGMFTVSVFTGRTRKVDLDRLREELGDELERFITYTTYEQIRITPVGITGARRRRTKEAE